MLCRAHVQQYLLCVFTVTFQHLIHENFTGVAPYLNDVALVKLPRPATLNTAVQMACLPLDQNFAAKTIGATNLRY